MTTIERGSREEQIVREAAEVLTDAAKASHDTEVRNQRFAAAEALRSILPQPRWETYRSEDRNAWGFRDSRTGAGYWLHGQLSGDQAERIAAILNEEATE